MTGAPSLAQFWIETGAMIAVLVAIPAYLGIVHADLIVACAYASVGGLAMAVGEALQFGGVLRFTVGDVVLWSTAIAGTGGVAYALALILV
jgi:hypothetical protein